MCSSHDNSGAVLAHRPAGFLFPRLPVLQGDPADEDDVVAAPFDSGHGSTSEHHKMTCGQFVLVTFFIVAGGPTGVETVVSSAGPFYAFIGLLIIPWLWYCITLLSFSSLLHAPNSIHHSPSCPLSQVLTHCARIRRACLRSSPQRRPHSIR
jgi:hypothetical protein